MRTRQQPAEQDGVAAAERWARTGKNERKKVFSRPEWYAAEREGLKDKEMRATAYLAGSLKLQNGDEKRAGKGLKAYRPACAIASYII